MGVILAELQLWRKVFFSLMQVLGGLWFSIPAAATTLGYFLIVDDSQIDSFCWIVEQSWKLEVVS